LATGEDLGDVGADGDGADVGFVQGWDCLEGAVHCDGAEHDLPVQVGEYDSVGGVLNIHGCGYAVKIGSVAVLQLGRTLAH
jgi:hypothetical protein